MTVITKMYLGGASDDISCVNDDIPGTELPGYDQPALPGPADELIEDSQADAGQNAEPEDISDELLGDDGQNGGIPFQDDGYSFEEREDNENDVDEGDEK